MSSESALARRVAVAQASWACYPAKGVQKSDALKNCKPAGSLPASGSPAATR